MSRLARFELRKLWGRPGFLLTLGALLLLNLLLLWYLTRTDGQTPELSSYRALAEDPLKGEYFLPGVVSSLIAEGKARVKVLHSADKWYGVTYQQDKPVVAAALAEMTRDGLYPELLWSK